ncbi:hypothetical protein VFPBJ_02796 [Purpureocillium lilacinum]|uniref:Uncharacterized protein n=1 Tax=Purpureocillium lilacinum TaxID=33203 RepID=A0A179H2V1_PURLI|nr:hypothetical protein VFPBJ_02796 [Purpureocillium lilacinum]
MLATWVSSASFRFAIFFLSCPDPPSGRGEKGDGERRGLRIVKSKTSSAPTLYRLQGKVAPSRTELKCHPSRSSGPLVGLACVPSGGGPPPPRRSEAA